MNKKMAMLVLIQLFISVCFYFAPNKYELIFYLSGSANVTFCIVYGYSRKVNIKLRSLNDRINKLTEGTNYNEAKLSELIRKHNTFIHKLENKS